jgi:hypothetical protein
MKYVGILISQKLEVLGAVSESIEPVLIGRGDAGYPDCLMGLEGSVFVRKADGTCAKIKDFKPVVVCRIERNGELLGYDIEVTKGGKVVCANINTLCALQMFVPFSNAYARMTPGGNVTLVGKDKTRLTDLPVREYGSNPSQPKPADTIPTKRETLHAQAKSDKAKQKKAVGLFEVVETVRKCGGSLAKFEDDGYVAATIPGQSDEFTELERGEVCKPYLDVGTSKLNVNLAMRKPGTVQSGGVMHLTFVYRTKSVIRDNKTILPRLGMVVSRDKVDVLTNALGGYNLAPVDDKKVSKGLIQLSGVSVKNSAVFELDLSGVPILGGDLSKHILSAKDLYTLLANLEVAKLEQKLYNEAAKTFKGSEDTVLERFTGLSDSQRMHLSTYIDLRTGALNEQKVERDEDSKGEGDAAIEIIYELSGYKTQTGKALFAGNFAEGTPKNIIQLQRELVKLSGDALFDIVTQGKATVGARIDGYKERLFKHKSAMATLGSGVLIHQHDKGEWASDESYRGAGDKYLHGSGVNVKCKGIRIDSFA